MKQAVLARLVLHKVTTPFYIMETNIPDYDSAPKRKVRTNWFLIAVIILLGIVTLVQSVILYGTSERSDWSLVRALRERLQKVWPGIGDKSRQTVLNPSDNQVVFWETTDDLDQIHDQINRLLRNMTTTLGSHMTGGPFPGTPFSGVAIRRESGNRPPVMSPDRDLDRLQREIERIFEHAYNESQQSSLLSRIDRGWNMVAPAAAMNIEDQGSNYVVTVAMPGFEKQGIAISLEGRLLIIEANQPTRAPAAAGRNAPIARQGRFHTRIVLPDNIEGAGAQAAYEHDVLCVRVPKAAQTNSLVRSIAIR